MNNLSLLMEKVFSEGNVLRLIFSNPYKKEKDALMKVSVSPFESNEEIKYQFTYHFENRVAHSNLNKNDSIDETIALITKIFKQVLITASTKEYHILSNKNGKINIIERNTQVLKDIKLSALHRRIGFIMQDNHLYNMSIKDNLLLVNPTATDEEQEEACKKACILDFITQLPEGFNTVIGEAGCKLSGGQKQRIVLARAFLKDVDVYIFDEATSALDQYNEKVINDVIDNISKDKIVIIVAHREASIQMCDRVIHLDK